MKVVVLGYQAHSHHCVTITTSVSRTLSPRTFLSPQTDPLSPQKLSLLFPQPQGPAICTLVLLMDFDSRDLLDCKEFQPVSPS